MRAQPVHPAAIDAVRAKSGASGVSEQAVIAIDPALLQYTPGFAAMVSLEALAACNALGHRGQTLDACLDHSTAPNLLVNQVR